jgi:hypothetical protein
MNRSERECTVSFSTVGISRYCTVMDFNFQEHCTVFVPYVNERRISLGLWDRDQYFKCKNDFTRSK